MEGDTAMGVKHTLDTPDGMPELSPGLHRNINEGACIMEYVSVLAGERFSDHPKCVLPVLASVARIVNDRISDAGRARLAPLAPDFIGTASGDPRVAHAILLHCLAFVEHPDARSRAIRVLERSVRGHGRRGRFSDWVDGIRVHRVARCILDAVAHKRPASDEDLHRLLITCLGECRDRVDVPERVQAR